MLTIILMPMAILLSTSNLQKRKKRLRKPERSVKPKAMPRLIPKLGITDIMDMVDTTDIPTDMVDTMDILMDTDTTDMANRLFQFRPNKLQILILKTKIVIIDIKLDQKLRNCHLKITIEFKIRDIF